MSAGFRISRALSSLQPPATLIIGARAAELARAGRDVIAMSMGEPDLSPPENAKEAAIRAIREKRSPDTPNLGNRFGDTMGRDRSAHRATGRAG